MATTNRSYDDALVLNHLATEHGLVLGETLVTNVDVDFDPHLPGEVPMALVTVELTMEMTADEARGMLDTPLS